MPRAAAILDRDGTIIEDAHYPKDPQKVQLIPGAVEGLQALRRKGYLIFVVSNQSGVGRGLIEESEFLAVHRRFCEVLQAAGAEVDEFGYCLHSPDDPCRCRKPKTGLVPRRFRNEAIDFARSVVIGDRESDLALGEELGARSILVRTGKGLATEDRLSKQQTVPFSVYDSLSQAVTHLPDLKNNA
jgi:histidinol-phosphate phosphatase family protein